MSTHVNAAPATESSNSEDASNPGPSNPELLGEHLAEAAEMLRLLTDRTRLAVLHQLASGPADRRTLTEAVGAAAPLVSQHLARLRLAGLVTSTKRDGSVVYGLSHPALRCLAIDVVRFAARDSGADAPDGQRQD